MSSRRAGISFKVSKGDIKMRENELRIGNLVFDRIGIVTIGLNAKIDFADIYNPIPLTEEWLLKLGFENSKRIWNRYRKEGIYPRYFWFKFFKNGRVDFWYSDFNLGKVNDLKYNPVKYVHQIQNLYFQLTGKEILQ